MIVFAIMRGFGFGGGTCAVVAVGLCFGAFTYFQRTAAKHGDGGLAKIEAHRKRPRIVVVDSRATFLRLKRTQRG